MQTVFSQTYFHGTKADLRLGDLITIGRNSNYGERKQAEHGAPNLLLATNANGFIW